MDVGAQSETSHARVTLGASPFPRAPPRDATHPTFFSVPPLATCWTRHTSPPTRTSFDPDDPSLPDPQRNRTRASSRGTSRSDRAGDSITTIRRRPASPSRRGDRRARGGSARTVVRPAFARRARLFWNDILRLFSESRRARASPRDGVASRARVSSSILRRSDTGGTHDDSRANRRASTTDSITLLFAAPTSAEAGAGRRLRRCYRRVITGALLPSRHRTRARRGRLEPRPVRGSRRASCCNSYHIVHAFLPPTTKDHTRSCSARRFARVGSTLSASRRRRDRSRAVASPSPRISFAVAFRVTLLHLRDGAPRHHRHHPRSARERHVGTTGTPGDARPGDAAALGDARPVPADIVPATSIPSNSSRRLSRVHGALSDPPSLRRVLHASFRLGARSPFRRRLPTPRAVSLPATRTRRALELRRALSPLFVRTGRVRARAAAVREASPRTRVILGRFTRVVPGGGNALAPTRCTFPRVRGGRVRAAHGADAVCCCGVRDGHRRAPPGVLAAAEF